MKVLCLDIGASSGRFIVVEFINNNFIFDETYRFYNGMEYDKDKHLIWNFSSLWNEIKKGLQISLKKYSDIKSIGIDTWAVDYGRLDKNNNLISEPYAYRDERCLKSLNKFLSNNSYYDIYKYSGIQKLPFNTIFQLDDDIENNRELNSILLIPDLIAYYLTGEKYTELTNLSTTALYNPVSKEIDANILKLMNINKNIFSKLIYPSKKIGNLKEELVKELDIYNIEVISVGSHDSASAIASIPLDNKSCYLSSGTRSLLGVELTNPLINEEAYKNNFTNEIGLEHSVRFLKNIMGLFIVQEYRKDLIKEGNNISFASMLEEAKKVNDNNVYIDVDDELFSTPFDMKNKIIKYLKNTNQKYDLTVGETTRMIYESLAFKYKVQFEKLKEITKLDVKKLYIVGGGANIVLLNQLTADILNVDVIEGEKEGTVVGNSLAQFIYFKEFKDLKDARNKLKESRNYKVYKPNNNDYVNQKYKDYLNTIERK